jgi:hypothetical protein
VRWQHIVYAVLPLSAIIAWWLSMPAGERRPQAKRTVLLLLMTGLGAAAVLALQLGHWRLQYGQWITVPQGATFMDWTAPYWQQVLFSSFKGLLTWMPVFFLALAGLLLQIKKHRRFLLPLLIVLLLQTYVNSSSNDWFGGGGYGPRRFTGELAILIIGYAGFLQWLPGRIRLLTGGILAGALVLHQWLLLRFGLDNEIGGRVLSMAPDYRWAESDYGSFLRQLGTHLANLAPRPLQILHWPNSPLGRLYEGEFPTRHLAALALSGLFVALCWLLARRLLSRGSRISRQTNWLLLILLALIILGANVWLWTWA